MTITLGIADAFIDNIANLFDRKKHIFKNGTKWLIYKCNIIKLYLETFSQNEGTQDFDRFFPDKSLYTELNFYLYFLTTERVLLKKQF